jgi:hypothetical protein
MHHSGFTSSRRTTSKVSKDDFYRAFPNVVRSSSYQEAGVYHYPTVPRAAHEFLVSSALTDESPD